ncbi:GH25 family lysozyme [Lacticaseibacillus absianus]|uniref:GH25 family lysozyme n=1 Tax=Lacticaseibacillus absianus TaxID=2729623 RepID=UPI0015CCBF92|nr:GH25 family lysozyme [Lacticaseibacillus absianus]
MTNFFVADVSSHDTIDAAALPQIGAVIIKATQGTTYVNPKCNGQYAAAKAAGKKLGLYHYAAGGDPVAEADYFISNINNYVGEALLAVDWEGYQNAAYGKNSNWVKQFVTRVHDLTNQWCLLYTGAEGARECANVKDLCGLWFAGYPYYPGTQRMYPTFEVPAKFPYSTAPWPTYTMWQFTSSDGTKDMSISNMPIESWDKFIGKAIAPVPNPVPAKTVAQLATEVIAGKYGSGDARKAALGSQYAAVQAEVNRQLGSKTASKPAAPKPATTTGKQEGVWYAQTGSFTITDSSGIKLRSGSASVSAPLLAVLAKGSVVKYNAYGYFGGYVWIRQPRSGGYGYLPTGTASGTKRTSYWGNFK